MMYKVNVIIPIELEDVMNHSFYTHEELEQIGFGKIGDNVKISRRSAIYNPENIQMGSNVRIDDFCVLSAGQEICIGNYVHIADYCALYADYGIILEDFTGLASRVTIYTLMDSYIGGALTNLTVPDKYRTHAHKGTVVLHKHSVVGTASTVIPGVVIGEGAAVMAHSFVTKNCEPWNVYNGNPAKPFKERSQKLLMLEKNMKMDGLL